MDTSVVLGSVACGAGCAPEHSAVNMAVNTIIIFRILRIPLTSYTVTCLAQAGVDHSETARNAAFQRPVAPQRPRNKAGTTLNAR